MALLFVVSVLILIAFWQGLKLLGRIILLTVALVALFIQAYMPQQGWVPSWW